MCARARAWDARRDDAVTCYAGVIPGVAQRRVGATINVAVRVRDAIAVAWRTRRQRLWIAFVAVPLAELATGLLKMWWTWPPLLACTWLFAPDVAWGWVLAFELGFVGVAWATAGIAALVHLPTLSLLVGAVWAAFPLALAWAERSTPSRYTRPIRPR